MLIKFRQNKFRHNQHQPSFSADCTSTSYAPAAILLLWAHTGHQFPTSPSTATLHGKEADILHLNPNICKHYWVHTVHKKRLQNFVDIPTTQIVYKHIGHQWQTLGSTVTSHTRKPEYKKYPSLLWTVKSWRRLCTFYWLQKKLKLLLRSRSQVTIVAGTTLIAWWWYQRMSDLLSKELPQHTTTKHTIMSDFLAVTVSPPK